MMCVETHIDGVWRVVVIDWQPDSFDFFQSQRQTVIVPTKGKDAVAGSEAGTRLLVCFTAAFWRRLGPVATLWILAISTPAQPIYQQIKSFGSPQLSASTPTSKPLQGSDGRWYWTAGGGAFGRGVILSVGEDGGGHTLVHRFINPPSVYPFGNLCEASDGALYGLTQSPLSLYKISKDGSGFSSLRELAAAEGSYRSAGLVESADGWLYGTAQQGGSHGGGTIFRLDKNGANFLVLRHFRQTANDGFFPEGALIAASDGALYGTTSYGGTNQGGTVFRLNTDGTGFEFLRHFGLDTNGYHPAAGLIEASDGVLYGTTSYGGSNNAGTLFKLNKNGSAFKTLFDFPANYHSELSLAEGGDGALYGLSRNYNFFGSSRVFKINKDGTGYRVLRGFSPGSWSTGMTPSPDGRLFGVTFDGLRGTGMVFRMDTNGSAFSVLTTYGVAGGDGSWPSSGLIELSDGALCGTTENGGSNYSGTVFKLNKDGSDYVVLHHFTASEAGSASATVTEGSDGVLYGTTTYPGGTNQSGTLFTMKKDGTAFQILHHFDWRMGDIASGQGPLAEAGDGKLYGTTSSSVFRLNKDGSGYEVIYRFLPSGVGNLDPGPNAIVVGSDAMIYGTTRFGGSNGFGTAFRLNGDGTGFKELHDFNSWDGANPQAPLCEASDGRLYGTTWGGGTNNAGVVFGLDKDGSSFKVLHYFTADNWRDGAIVNAGVTEGRDGALYGTTLRGGPSGDGTVFRLSKDGSSYGIVKGFMDSSYTQEGGELRGGLLQGSDGCFYGETLDGGLMKLGTVFRILPPVWVGPPELTATGNFLRISAPPGQTHRIQASTHLQPAVWETVGTGTADTNGWIRFLDSSAQGLPSRYYRTTPP